MKTTSILEPKITQSLLEGRLSKNQLASIEEIDGIHEFNGLVAHMESNEQRWVQVLDHPNSEEVMPDPWKTTNPDLSKEANILMKMLVLNVIRPDRLLPAAKELMSIAINDDSQGGQLDLGQIVELESKARNPLMLVSAPGYDASVMVDALAKEKNKKYTSVAIGSPEAFGEAENAIKLAARSGSWVLLKNVHLAPSWLVELEKSVYKLSLNDQFRLFLTMEVTPKVPKTLLRASNLLVFEPPSGIKASMTRSYTLAISRDRSNTKPVQRSKLHFIVAWFNAVVQERLRYIPIGWSKAYEFNQADQKCVLFCCDEWLDSIGKGREAVDPDKIPWDALRTLISQSIFGGKIDNDFDQKILMSLVTYFFRKETFDRDYPLFN